MTDKTIRVSPGAHTLFFIIMDKMHKELKVKPNSDFVLSVLMTTWIEKNDVKLALDQTTGSMYQLEEKPNYGDAFL